MKNLCQAGNQRYHWSPDVDDPPKSGLFCSCGCKIAFSTIENLQHRNHSCLQNAVLVLTDIWATECTKNCGVKYLQIIVEENQSSWMELLQSKTTTDKLSCLHFASSRGFRVHRNVRGPPRSSKCRTLIRQDRNASFGTSRPLLSGVFAGLFFRDLLLVRTGRLSCAFLRVGDDEY